MLNGLNAEDSNSLIESVRIPVPLRKWENSRLD